MLFSYLFFCKIIPVLRRKGAIMSLCDKNFSKPEVNFHFSCCLMNMKHLRYIFVGVLATLTLFSCRSSRAADGWYPVTDDADERVEGPAIVTVKDFDVLSIDSVSTPHHYIITGRLKAEKVSEWSDVTKQRMGKRIGFLFENNIIMAPRVNCPIETGAFSIETDDNALTLRIYETLKGKL